MAGVENRQRATLPHRQTRRSPHHGPPLNWTRLRCTSEAKTAAWAAVLHVDRGSTPGRAIERDGEDFQGGWAGCQRGMVWVVDGMLNRPMGLAKIIVMTM